MYMVSAQKPTAVTHSMIGNYINNLKKKKTIHIILFKGRITSSNDLNLIICKNSLIEIYRVTSEGLKFLKQITIWGVVETLNMYRNKYEKKDNLLVTTAKYDVMVLSFDLNSNGFLEVITKSLGSVKDPIPRQSATHMITVVDESRNIVAIKCYDGILKTLNLNSEHKQLSLSNLR